MPAEDRITLEVKYKSPQIYKLNDDDISLHSLALLLKIHVITGWRLPDSTELLTVLKDQFRKKLQENYSNCNVDEIEFAFRNYGTSEKDWGKDLNLAFVDTVMRSYLSHRKQLSDMEESMSTKKQITYNPTDEDLLSLSRESIEGRYQSFLSGNSSFHIQPPDGIATLALDGFCEYDLHEDFIERAFEIIKSKMKNECDNALLNGKNALAEKMKANIELLKTDDDSVIMLSKKIALVYCFYKFKENGLQNIYIKENNG